MPVSKPKIGDILWARVPPLPWWPGQVMDPALMGSKKLAKKPAEGKYILISFFGDSTYNWVEVSYLENFEANLENKQKQNVKSQLTKSFKQAIEEAKEVIERRAGRTPATDHEPIDFLRPSTWPAELQAAEEDKMYFAEPPTMVDVESCSAADALEWLRNVTNTLVVKLTRPPLDEPEARLIYSTIVHQGQEAAYECDDSARPSLKRAEEAPSSGEAGARKRPKTTATPSSSGAGGSKQIFAPEQVPSDEEESDDDLPLGEAQKKSASKASSSKPKAGATIDGFQPSRKVRARAAAKVEDLYRFGRPMAPTVLAEVPDLLQAAAADPAQLLQEGIGEAGGAFLRWREAVYSRSCWAKDSDLGMVTRMALEACGSIPKAGEREELQALELEKAAERAKARAAAKAEKERRAQMEAEGIVEGEEGGEAKTPGAPKSEKKRKRREGEVDRGAEGPIIEVKVKEYLDRVGTREEFTAAVAKFAEEQGKQGVPVPVIHGHNFDSYFIFKEVARLGGMESVSAQRLWRRVALAWKPELESIMTTSTPVLRAYKLFLADYEESITQDVPYTTISARQWGPRRPSMKSQTPTQKTPKTPKTPAEAQEGGAAGDGAGEGQEGDNGQADAAKLAEARPVRSTVKPFAKEIKEAADRALMGAARRKPPAHDHAMSAFDDLIEDDTSAPRSASGGAGGAKPSSAGDAGQESTASLGNREYRRVLLKFPEKQSLPPKHTIMSFARAQFDYIDYDDVELNPMRSVVHITYRQHEDAEKARQMWSSKAHLMFSFPDNAIDVSLVRANATLKKARPEPALPVRALPSRPNGASATGIPLGNALATDPRRSHPLRPNATHATPGGLGHYGSGGYSAPGLGPSDPRRAGVSPLASYPPAGPSSGPRPMQSAVSQLSAYTDSFLQAQQAPPQQRYTVQQPIRPTPVLPSIIPIPIHHQPGIASLYSPTHLQAQAHHAYIPSSTTQTHSQAAAAYTQHSALSGLPPQRAAPTNADPFAGVDINAIQAALNSLQPPHQAQQHSQPPQQQQHQQPAPQQSQPAQQQQQQMPGEGGGSDGDVKADIMKLLQGIQ